MRIAITADSTCDLPRSLCQERSITLIPLTILCNGEPSLDGLEISPQEVIACVEHGGKVSTSAVNVTEYQEIFSRLLKDHDAVVHLALSSSVSSSCANAVQAAAGLPVKVIDTASLHTGSALLALDAADLRDQDWDLDAICQEISRRIPLVDGTFLVSDVGYLARGGRCSAASALGAKLLSIQPSIVLHEGHMIAGPKYRGTLHRALARYMQDRLAVPDVNPRRVFVSHSPCDPQLFEEFKAQLLASGRFEEVLETEAGCVICSHCGPNTFSVMFERAR